MVPRCSAFTHVEVPCTWIKITVTSGINTRESCRNSSAYHLATQMHVAQMEQGSARTTKIDYVFPATKAACSFNVVW